jgi:hypothetical protein
MLIYDLLEAISRQPAKRNQHQSKTLFLASVFRRQTATN